ncbi:hypothetical protein NM688_g8472 [Phlebia brevispora]|uniref:Uncharacterized protein n=1 Tax=Phlebia brevispora TaxID=194682 RepID=A0ACC1RUI0_9APHY|nr:hypothetical protein NM688_g8472 [Phlebia brevispora]
MSSEPRTASDAAAASIFKKPVPNYHTTSTLKRNTHRFITGMPSVPQTEIANLYAATAIRNAHVPHACVHTRPHVHGHTPRDYSLFDVLVDLEARPTKSKYEVLEGRISELEGLLREMGVTLTSQSSSTSPSSGPSIRSSPEVEIIPGPAKSVRDSPENSPPHEIRSPQKTRDDTSATSPSNNSTGGLLTLPRELKDATVEYLRATTSRTPQLVQKGPINGDDLRVLPMGWPAGLPNPEITRHLVQAFFAFHMYAGRLFHGPTFISSLNLHPSDQRFPSPCLLHAMCAVGSMYTADIPPTPIHTSGIFPYEVFAGRWRKAQSRPDSFAEQQVKLAKFAVDDMLDTGTNLVEVLQTIILLAWFYKCQGRWSEAYLAAGLAVRCAIPCGLNTRAPFACNTSVFGVTPVRTTTIIPPARSTTEDETRVNIFWIAYALERQQVSGNSYSSVLDDHDIYQLLPVRRDKFEQGAIVQMSDRQWSHDDNILLVHPKNGTDSFSLFVKSMMVLSRVKRFNTRYKGRFYAGDPDMYSPSSVLCASLEDLDPRDTPAFREVDNLVSSFYSSFPQNMRDPIQEETVDSYLYTACCSAHLAHILLHEPYADLGSSTCISATKILAAARNIMDLIYSIASTSFDVSLLDSLPYMAWYNAGRVLTRFLKVAVESSMFDSIMTLQAEVSFVHAMLARAGERMPVAYRYKKIIYDLLVELCGTQFVGNHPHSSSKSVYIDPVHSSLIDPVPMASIFSPASTMPPMSMSPSGGMDFIHDFSVGAQ